ncbi:transmembrane domain-containing protein [Paraclostridium ghonii]|uniref:LPXTG-motif cell wall-anchored protein n=1 Tax=Paraclostridium ghonii TaxID=29358 RepID=A0ABU0MXB3_9FIRM|nr:LPXTG cell wall anchor domain-containing protein [Paeniclostridium ghonii]MDQ0555554.1 LPXTG-motif cell wall-anchored protein [Paeniclostridium ghonii]
MKKILISIFMIISVVMLTGCVNSDISLNIDKKGNASVTAKILSSDYLMNGINEQELKSNYDSVEKITEQGKTGYKITENLGNIANLKQNNIKGIDKFDDLVSVKKVDSFLSNTYDINIKLKDYMNKNISNEEMGMLNLFGSGFDLNFNLNIPMELVESNANSNSKKDGIYTYNWNLNLSNLENIHVKAKIPNVKNIMILSILGIILILGLAVFILKKRRNKNNK